MKVVSSWEASPCFREWSETVNIKWYVWPQSTTYRIALGGLAPDPVSLQCLHVNLPWVPGMIINSKIMDSNSPSWPPYLALILPSLVARSIFKGITDLESSHPRDAVEIIDSSAKVSLQLIDPHFGHRHFLRDFFWRLLLLVLTTYCRDSSGKYFPGVKGHSAKNPYFSTAHPVYFKPVILILNIFLP